MNRVFKTKWSVAHQEYVVTDEKHTTKTKSTKSAVALAVAAMMFAAGTASASFVDTSFVADNPFVFQQAKKSFETAEYQKNWGLSAMKASSAYALGYHGQGVKVGMMDSGFLTTHRNFPVIVGTPSRLKATTLRVANVIPSTHTAPNPRILSNITRAINSRLMALTTQTSTTTTARVAPVSMLVTAMVSACTA